MNAKTQAALDAYKAAREKLAALEVELAQNADVFDEWELAYAAVHHTQEAAHAALQKERDDDVHYIMGAYGFVLPAHVLPVYVPSAEFAELMERALSREIPRNAWAIDRVREVGGYFARTHDGYHYMKLGA